MGGIVDIVEAAGSNGRKFKYWWCLWEQVEGTADMIDGPL